MVTQQSAFADGHTGKTRVALAGFGAWGQMHARAIAAIADAEIVAVYCHGDTSEAAATEILPRARRYRDYHAMLRAGGFEVVNITVPNHMHAPFTVAALEAGTHVFAEKPLGLSLQQCDAVIATQRRTGGLVAVGHELRVSRQWGGVREIIARGDIGKVRHQHFSLFRHAFRQGSGGWRYDMEKVGSWILEELVHFFDLVLWYAAENGAPTRVYACGNGRNSTLAENLVTTLEWADGSTAVLSQCLAGFEHHSLLELAGTQGAIRTWWSGTLDRTLTPTFELKAKRGPTPVDIVAVPQSGEVFELEEILRRAYAGFHSGVSILPPNDVRASIAVCLAAQEAYRKGAAIELG
jgi:myo-inositol 2-dehydrogenase / D-chiro-inositol 1-dehydrogenase